MIDTEKSGQLWSIVKITAAGNEELPLFVDRDRIGKTVRNLYPFAEGMPLRMLYIGGEKHGGLLQHSGIVRVVTGPESVKVYTLNTMYELKPASGHVWHSCNDEDCFVCTGGLAQCVVCGGAEGWLTTHCPGEHVPYETAERVGHGELDYKDGKWIEKGEQSNGNATH